MNKLTALTLIILAALFGSPQAASAIESNNTNTISGVVFIDTDGDGIQTPNEVNVGHATVNFQALNAGTVQRIQSNESGYFTSADLQFGLYEIWAEIDGRSSPKQIVEVSEVIGTSNLDLGIVESIRSTQSFSLHLPFISN